MKIGILTSPLKSNYGGILQNWALQQVLIKLGHKPITIDVYPHPGIKIFILSTIKSILLWFIPSHRRKFTRWNGERSSLFDNFVRERIVTSHLCRYYTMSIVKEYELDALIVGSDQVWRPRYNVRTLPDMFLRFAHSFKGRKIAYAASFGVNNWEFSKGQTSLCATLVKQFDAISVRESSGVDLCEKYLGVNAISVLDPTLLLAKDEYAKLCEEIPICNERFLAVYVLDPKKDVEGIIKEEAKKRGLAIKYFSADRNANLKVEEWLAIFRDASFVVTDSFHGTIFSIIFEKEFRNVVNMKRGCARFVDIINKYKSNSLGVFRKKSLDFIRDSLV